MCTDIGLAVTEQRQDTEEMEMGEIQWDGPCWSEVSGCWDHFRKEQAWRPAEKQQRREGGRKEGLPRRSGVGADESVGHVSWDIIGSSWGRGDAVANLECFGRTSRLLQLASGSKPKTCSPFHLPLSLNLLPAVSMTLRFSLCQPNVWISRPFSSSCAAYTIHLPLSSAYLPSQSLPLPR